MRSLLPTLLTFVLLLSTSSFLRSAPTPAGRPNLLFVYTDDQSFDALSIVQREQGEKGRFPWLRTPNLDRLAGEGLRFRNAFVINSLCSPSRAVTLTGRYNHHNGIASNFRPFPVNNVTQATLLREAGYTTAYIGKWHMGSQRERPGFDHHASYVGHGRYEDCPFIVDGKDTPTTGWVDDVATDYAIGFIHRQKATGKPWSLMLGFKTPHEPWQPPARAKDLYTGEMARSVPNFHTPPPYLRAKGQAPGGKPVPPTVRVNLDYFRCLTAMDDCMGRLLSALDEAGLTSNTLVMFTSDNGFYLGAHATGDKRSAYEESLRVPLLVRYPALGPGAPGRLVDDMVLNLDHAPTMLDFAGVPVPKEMQGQSLRPLLSGEPVAWRQSWFYEYFTEDQKGSKVPDITAVRTPGAKLIKYVGFSQWNELFDLTADPYETKNLFHDPAAAALREKLLAEHDRLARETGYQVPASVSRPANWGQPGSLAGERGQPD
jgi:arylsulfatase A-like enzyme